MSHSQFETVSVHSVAPHYELFSHDNFSPRSESNRVCFPAHTPNLESLDKYESSHCGNSSHHDDPAKEVCDNPEKDISSHRGIPSHCGNPKKDESSHRGIPSHCGNPEKYESSHRGITSHCGNPEKDESKHCGIPSQLLSHHANIETDKSNHRVTQKKSLNPYAPIFHAKSIPLHGHTDPTQYLVQLFETVYKSSVPNYQSCRIPLKFTTFNIPLWRQLLHDFNDRVICDFLEFGFPLDFDKSKSLCTEERRNHKGARDHVDYINEYIVGELNECRIAGPFDSNPFSVSIMCSPLNSVPKPCGTERRVIVDLSWPPEKGSVNSGISKDFYLEQKIELHYASVEDVCQIVMEIGRGAVIYKRDLRKAYRQFPVDPGDYYLLGYYWQNKYYFDTALAMGQRNAGIGCSRVTRAIMHIHGKSGHKGISYLDDLIGVSHPANGDIAFDQLGRTLDELGLKENFKKACPPSTSQTVLGVLVDTVDMTVSTTEERLAEIHELLDEWLTKKACTRKELMKIIGKLAYVCKCVRQSRIFLNRLLEVLRAVEWKTSNRIKLSDEFRKDLKWWSLFMDTFNGVALIPAMSWVEPDVSMATDSCLEGCGGICTDQYFHSVFPEFIKREGLPIHKLEFLAILIGARIWGSRFSGLKIRMYCDNQAVVDVINSSKTRDPFMATCLRELWLVVSTNKFELRAVHLPGVENRIADWLSRWHRGQKYQKPFNDFIAGSSYQEIVLSDKMFKFSETL